MSPAPIAHGAADSATPPQHSPDPGTVTPHNKSSHFDDIFKEKFMAIIQHFKDNPRTGPLTSKDRKEFIETAYKETDNQVYGNRPLSDHELKLQAMTKVFYKILADEPWSDEWIRSPDVERKLSRWEMHKDSIELAAQHGWHTPRDCITAAREHLIRIQKLKPEGRPGLRGPFEDIEVTFIAGTVSSSATNKIDRDNIYPVSVSSVAYLLQNHMCRDMTRPHDMAEKWVTCTDTEELTQIRQFACDIVDYAPHLLDNDNTSLLLVLLALTRSEIVKRFENNGIRIEGSTISHRRAECLKQKFGWKSVDDRRQFDLVSQELQTRIKYACFPNSRTGQGRRGKPSRKSSSNSATPVATPTQPPIGFFPPPQSTQGVITNGHRRSLPGNDQESFYLSQGPYSMYAKPPPIAPASGSGSRDDPMDIS